MAEPPPPSASLTCSAAVLRLARRHHRLRRPSARLRPGPHRPDRRQRLRQVHPAAGSSPASCAPPPGRSRVAGEVGYLPQNLTLDTGRRSTDLLGIAERRAALHAIEARRRATRSTSPTVGDDWDVEERARADLDRLGLAHDRPRPHRRRVSGGESVLLAPGRAAAAPPGRPAAGRAHQQPRPGRARSGSTTRSASWPRRAGRRQPRPRAAGPGRPDRRPAPAAVGPGTAATSPRTRRRSPPSRRRPSGWCGSPRPTCGGRSANWSTPRSSWPAGSATARRWTRQSGEPEDRHAVRASGQPRSRRASYRTCTPRSSTRPSERLDEAEEAVRDDAEIRVDLPDTAVPPAGPCSTLHGPGRLRYGAARRRCAICAGPSGSR